MSMGSGPMGAFGNPAVLGQLGALNVGLGQNAQGAPGGGHGRRHSVNVVNKTGGHNNMGSISFGAGAFPQDGFDDGFAPPPGLPGGHSRQASRADSSWRISMCETHLERTISNSSF